jgi:hypothetical protein
MEAQPHQGQRLLVLAASGGEGLLLSVVSVVAVDK